MNKIRVKKYASNFSFYSNVLEIFLIIKFWIQFQPRWFDFMDNYHVTADSSKEKNVFVDVKGIELLKFRLCWQGLFYMDMIHLEIAHSNAQLNNYSFVDTVAIKIFYSRRNKKADYARDKQQS